MSFLGPSIQQAAAKGQFPLAASIKTGASMIPNLSFSGGAAGPAVSGAPSPYNVTYGAKNSFGVFGFGAVVVIVVGYIVVKALVK